MRKNIFMLLVVSGLIVPSFCFADISVLFKNIPPGMQVSGARDFINLPTPGTPLGGDYIISCRGNVANGCLLYPYISVQLPGDDGITNFNFSFSYYPSGDGITWKDSANVSSTSNKYCVTVILTGGWYVGYKETSNCNGGTLSPIDLGASPSGTNPAVYGYGDIGVEFTPR